MGKTARHWGEKMNLKEAAQQALEALEEYQQKGAPFMSCDAAVDALRAALNQERYVVTGNEFHGAPPEPYANWGDAIEAMIDRGVIQGLRISALAEDRPADTGETKEQEMLRRKWFGGRDTGHLSFVEAVTERQDWDEIESLRASLREHMAEIKRLNECLTWEQHRAERIGTHGPGCAMWGPKHYECLLREHDALQKQTSQESRQVKPVAWMLEEHGELSVRKTIPPREEVSWREKLELPAWVPLYAAPPKREPLTESFLEELAEKHVTHCYFDTLTYAREIERLHGVGGKE